MTSSAWAIRFYTPFVDKTYSFISSFRGFGERDKDRIVVFSGIYGVQDYMMWYTEKDLTSYDFDEFAINLRLFLHGNPKAPYFDENYRIQDCWYDTKKDKFVVFAVHEDYLLLDMYLREFKVGSLSYKEIRSPKDVLKDVLEDHDIIPVNFHEHDNSEYRSFSFEYKKLTVQDDWTVRDFISYIANENDFEWCIKYGQLHIGPELKAYDDLNAKRSELLYSIDNISKGINSMIVTTEAIPLDVLYNWDKEYRCLWARHEVGDEDLTIGCFAKIGEGRMPIERYVETLQGDMERAKGFNMLTSKKTFSPVMLGKIKSDGSNSSYIEKTSVTKDIDKYAIKEPKDVVIDVNNPLYLIERLTRTSPYLEDGAGLLFPSVTNPANSLIFNPEGRIETAVQGPFVYGDGSDDFVIPKKNEGDFRFHMGVGWDMFVSSDGETIFTFENDDPENIPSNKSTVQIYVDPGTNLIQIKKDNNNILEIDGTTINILADGTININGSSTKLEGGGNKLSHSDHRHNYQHVHTTGNMGVPIPPQNTTIPGTIYTDQHVPTEGTTTTEAD